MKVVGLKWSDLDRTAKRLSIVRTLQNLGSNPVESDVKTRTSRRCIDIDDTTMRVLARRRQKLNRPNHTHASFLIAAGVPIKVVSERLGHSHPRFTMNTYQHVMPGMSSAAADQFAALIANATR